MQQLEIIASDIWNHVCQNITDILRECEMHGLANILCVPNPSIENRINALKSLDKICQLIIDNTSDDQYSVSRTMFNAKQQILNLEFLLTSARNNDSAGFEEAKQALSKQSTH